MTEVVVKTEAIKSSLVPVVKRQTGQQANLYLSKDPAILKELEAIREEEENSQESVLAHEIRLLKFLLRSITSAADAADFLSDDRMVGNARALIKDIASIEESQTRMETANMFLQTDAGTKKRWNKFGESVRQGLEDEWEVVRKEGRATEENRLLFAGIAQSIHRCLEEAGFQMPKPR